LVAIFTTEKKGTRRRTQTRIKKMVRFGEKKSPTWQPFSVEGNRPGIDTCGGTKKGEIREKTKKRIKKSGWKPSALSGILPHLAC